MTKYDPKKIEAKWQKYWQENKTFVSSNDSKKDKKYVLVEFPYPSGVGLHMGHVRPYTAADVTARYYRLKGFEVMFPMGWDAFGLPAENYAIKTGKPPAQTTEENIANIKRQITEFGYSFDWDREINTTDPNYYKWTQWLFLQFYKAGLAFEDTGLINWCPKDKTGLANEEVINGECERCGAKVEKKELKQWYLKITEYAEKLLQGLDGLDKWPDAVKLQQQNWIGKSEGAEIEFSVIMSDSEGSRDSSLQASRSSEYRQDDIKIKVFTTRPDTIFGATYLVVAPEHPLLKELKIDNQKEVGDYIEKATDQEEQDRTREDKEKTGVELKGIKAVNPASGEEIPVWVADYVLGNYGTGAIMAVPAHDERDFEFATKFDLPIKPVVVPTKEPINGYGVGAMLLTSDGKFVLQRRDQNASKDPYKVAFFGGGVEGDETIENALLRELKEELSLDIEFSNFKYFHSYTLKKDQKNVFGQLFVANNIDAQKLDLNEGAKIEILTAEEVLNHPDTTNFVKEVVAKYQTRSAEVLTEPGLLFNSGEFDGMASEEALPKMAEKYGQPKTTYRLRDWVFSRQRYWGEPIPIIHCDKDGIVPVPENQLPVTLPEVENYEPTGTGQSPLAGIDEWVNTECSECGGPAKRETNTMPQWAGSSWYFLRYADSKNDKEFASKDSLKYWMPVDIYFGGMEHTTLHLLYSRFWNIFLHHDQGLVPVSEPYVERVPHGIVLASDGTKMSKSKGNVVNPDELTEKYGADVTRMYELFLGPHGQMVAWNEDGITGVSKFLARVWTWLTEKEFGQDDSKTLSELHRLIKDTDRDIASYAYNTAVSGFMKFYNEVKDLEMSKDSAVSFLSLLYPFAPHICEELYEILGGKGSVQDLSWPEYDADKVVQDIITIAVQVNGKVRDEIEVDASATEDEIKTQALASEKVQKFIAGEPKKIIYVPQKLINFVG
ncbi:MAG: leucine--tRNA ligase [Candidatus Doudnabacteria bacterium]